MTTKETILAELYKLLSREKNRAKMSEDEKDEGVVNGILLAIDIVVLTETDEDL